MAIFWPRQWGPLYLWQDWFRKLRAEGDADPASALWCEETAVQSIRVLCIHRVPVPPFDHESEASLLAMLPPTPDWSMAGTVYRWDKEQQRFIAYQQSRWQEDPEFLGRYYGGAHSRCFTANRLRGAALQLLGMLERFPMTVLPFDRPAENSQAVQQTIRQEIERLNALHRLAGRCLNPVLRLHVLSHCGDGDRYVRDALLALQQAVNELADVPMADDPFSADEVVEEAGVTATSMHAAAFDIARQTWHSVQLASLAPGTCSDHADAAGQPYTRITSAVVRQAPTEAPWSADVWQRVRQQLADALSLDLERIQARLTLERIRAVRQIEARFAILVTGSRVIPSTVVAAQPAAQLPASPVVSPTVEQEMAGTSTPPQLPPDDDRPFLPSELHERIFEALQHKVLTLDALAAKLQVERGNLHRDGIKELKRRGLIDNNRRAGGYYRPDAPTPKYAEQLGKKPR